MDKGQEEGWEAAGSLWVEDTPHRVVPRGPLSAIPCSQPGARLPSPHTPRGSTIVPVPSPSPSLRSGAGGPAVQASPITLCSRLFPPASRFRHFVAGTRQITSLLPLCGTDTPSSPPANEAMRGLSQRPRASRTPGHPQTAGTAGRALSGGRSGQTAESRSPASLSREGVTKATFALEPPSAGVEDGPAQAGGSGPCPS